MQNYAPKQVDNASQLTDEAKKVLAILEEVKDFSLKLGKRIREEIGVDSNEPHPTKAFKISDDRSHQL